MITEWALKAYCTILNIVKYVQNSSKTFKNVNLQQNIFYGVTLLIDTGFSRFLFYSFL